MTFNYVVIVIIMPIYVECKGLIIDEALLLLGNNKMKQFDDCSGYFIP